MKNVILISAFNPDENLVNLIKAVMANGKEYISDIIVVDDGSRERTHYVFRRLRSIGIRVISQKEKLGVGVTMRAGLKLIDEKEPGIDGILVVGSVNSCTAEHILQVAKKMKENRNAAVIAENESESFSKGLKDKLRYGVNSWTLKLRTGVICSDPTKGVIGIPAEHIKLALATRGKNASYIFNLINGMVKSGAPVTSLRLAEVGACNEGIHGNDYRYKDII